MKLKKRIAAFGAASVMAVSMMSFGASASKLYTTQTATRQNVDKTYGMGLVPHYEKDLIYNYYGTKTTLGYLFSRAKAGGFWSWNTEAQSAALSAKSGSHPYASIMINGTTKSISDNATYNKGFEYTDWKETATSSKNHSVVFKIHCWY